MALHCRLLMEQSITPPLNRVLLQLTNVILVMFLEDLQLPHVVLMENGATCHHIVQVNNPGFTGYQTDSYIEKLERNYDIIGYKISYTPNFSLLQILFSCVLWLSPTTKKWSSCNVWNNCWISSHIHMPCWLWFSWRAHSSMSA